MEKGKKNLVDAARLITQAEYGTFKGIRRQYVYYLVQGDKLETVNIKGTRLICLTPEELIEYNLKFPANENDQD